MNNKDAQNGFSLVEIMVALVVGLILTAGVIQIFIANKQAYRVADASARIQENARFAMVFLGRQLRMAGYRNNTNQEYVSIFSPVSFSGYDFDAGEVIRGKENEIVFRYQGDGDTRDCEDNSLVAAGSVVTTRLFLDMTTNELKCLTDMDNLPDPSEERPILSDVADMVIHYGVDADGDGTADRYDQSSGVTNWKQVVSVRVSLLLQSPENNITTAPQSYTFNGETVTPADRRLRRVFTTTIGLRNRLP